MTYTCADCGKQLAAIETYAAPRSGVTESVCIDHFWVRLGNCRHLAEKMIDDIIDKAVGRALEPYLDDMPWPLVVKED